MATNPSYPDHDSTTTSSDDGPFETATDNRFGILPRAVAYANISVMAKAVYGVLVQFNVAFPSRQFIADRLGVSVSTIKRAISELVDAGFVAIEHRYSESGGQRSNLYHLGGMNNYSGPVQARPSPRFTHEPPPGSPMTPIKRQRERDNVKKSDRSEKVPFRPAGERRNYMDALDMVSMFEAEDAALAAQQKEIER